MLTYGNATRDLIPFLQTETFLDSLLSELYSYPYPDNNSQEVIDEINKLTDLTNSMANDQDKINRFALYDSGFENYLVNSLYNVGVPQQEVIDTINSLKLDILPLIIKLKYFYQRIRPNQLSHMLQMRLYPYPSISADTPSYPSGHTYSAKIYCNVLGNMYPRFFQELDKLAKDVSDSRQFMGLHYASDAAFANYVADCVLSHPEFKKKYRL